MVSRIDRSAQSEPSVERVSSAGTGFACFEKFQYRLVVNSLENDARAFRIKILDKKGSFRRLVK